MRVDSVRFAVVGGGITGLTAERAPRRRASLRLRSLPELEGRRSGGELELPREHFHRLPPHRHVVVASPLDVEISAEEVDAHAPVPHAAVSPEPRSQTRILTSRGDST